MTQGTRKQGREIGGISPRTAAWLAGSVLALTLLFGVLGCLLFFLNDHSPSGDTWYTLAFSAFSIVGVVIASRRPQNPIGWMFCIIGLANSIYFFADEYVVYALVTSPGVLPGSVWLAWSQIWTAFIMWYLMFFSLLLFPTGRLPSPRWQPITWALTGLFVLMTVLLVIKPGPFESNPRVRNPTGIEAAASIVNVSWNNILPIFTIIVLAAPAAVLVRFWRSRGEERQQLKWFAYAAGLWISVFGLDLLNQSVLHESVIARATDLLYGVGVAPIPIAVGIAILRYRLYNIDVVINRTLVYGSLTALLVLVYFGSVTATQSIFRALTGQQEQPQLAIVVSTLVIAALFNPLRRRIQDFIDRRFYRRKYDARKTLEAFSSKLRDETDLETLNNHLVEVVSETMQPAHVSLWLRPDRPPKGEQAE